MVQWQLRFIIHIICRWLSLSVQPESVGRVITIRLLTIHIILRNFLPSFNGKSVFISTLIMPLGSSKSSKWQLMIVIETLCNIHKPVVGFVVGSLDITIGPGLTSQKGHGPTWFGQSGRYLKQDFVQSVVTHTIRYETAFVGIDCISHNVDRTTHWRSRYLWCTQTTLYLHATSHITQTGPVRPIDATPFHIIHRNTVNHHSRVLGLKTTYVHFGVTKTTTLLSCIDTRSRLQNFRKLLCSELLLDKDRVNCRYSYRCFTRNSNRRSDDNVIQHHCIGCHFYYAQIFSTTFLGDLLAEFLVTKVLDKQRWTGGSFLCEHTIQVSHTTLGGTDNRYGCTNQWLTCFRIHNLTFHCYLGNGRSGRTYRQHCNQQEMN